MLEDNQGWIKFEGTADFFTPTRSSIKKTHYTTAEKRKKVSVGLCGAPTCHEMYGKCFGTKCPIGKMIMDKRKQNEGIITAPKITPEDIKFRNITYSLVKLSPQLMFPDAVQWLEVNNDELWILVQKDRFYKKKINPKRRELYGENNYLIFTLPQFAKKKSWKTYDDLVDFLSNFTFSTCKQVKDCNQSDCSLCHQYSCWLTPEYCTQNKKSGFYACIFCFYYRKGRPEKVISSG